MKTVIVTIFFGISVILPVTMIIIGSIYVNDCKIERKIPIWLIVSGSFSCLSLIFRTTKNIYVYIK
jgi:hypothetical protein